MKKYGNIEYRAKRYIVNVAHYGKGYQVSREETKLPSILASVINRVIFNKEHKLRVEIGKLQEYLNYCLWSYRDYYNKRSQLTES